MNTKQILEMITEEHIIDILIDLGSEEPERVNNGLLFTTVCHCGSRKKLHYHSDTKTFFCYTECGNLSNIFNLVMETKAIKFHEALNYVCKFMGISAYQTYIKEGFDFEKVDNSFLNKFDYEEEEVVQLEEKDEKVLNTFFNLYYEGWINEHISIETMKLFNIKFDIENYRIIIPHYDINNRLIGIRCRNLKQELVDKGLKYVPVYIDGELYNYPTSLNLYGMNINKENIKKYKRVIIGESEKFVMQHRSFDSESIAVALNGSALSQYQIDMLLELGVETVVLALDKEFKTLIEAEQYKEIIKKKYVSKLINYFNVEVIFDNMNLLDYKDSPTDKGKEVFDMLYKNRALS